MPRRPGSITCIALVNAAAAAFTLCFWLLVAFRFFLRPVDPSVMSREAAASTLGFLAADALLALPLLVLSVPGLLRMRFRGWTTAQAVNALWVYSLAATWTRDLYLGRLSPGSLLFLPFTLFAVWAFVHLWKNRTLFGVGTGT
jgi:hypothetical protein